MHPVLVDPEVLNHAFKFNPDLLSNFDKQQEFSNGIKQDDILQNPDLGFDSETPSVDLTESVISSDSLEVPDFSDACLKFLTDILLEEDLDEGPASAQEFTALQATEKSLYDALGEDYSPSSVSNPSSLGQSIELSNENFELSSGYPGIEGYVNGDITFESNWMFKLNQLDPVLTLDDISPPSSGSNSQSSGSSTSFDDSGDGAATSPASTGTSTAPEKRVESVNHSRKKKNHKRDEGVYEERRSSKQQASSHEDYVEMKEFDDVLLCKEEKDVVADCTNDSSPVEAREKVQKKGGKGRTTRGKKQNTEVEEVDLRTLLSHCAQAVSSFDLRSASEHLRQIRQHCSQYGDSLQRLAYYFANGLEARIAGTGSTISGNVVDVRISSSDFLKAYRLYVSAVPFKRMSYFLANNTIRKLAEKATRIHIIDFGVMLGLQWPCLIQNLSKRPTGPPSLRITGIDYPQHGFRPSERVEATGRRLAGYCERFNVPFKYKAIAKSWESIKLEDLEIAENEMVFVNCMFRSGTLLDETVVAGSPKDAFLRLIREVNPCLFIHGTINGSFNAPFFITRFREALFHYSSVFDIFEATMTREDHERLLVESEIYGKEALNVIACEGAERIQRPETYKQWQARTTRAGFRQLPLDQELVSRAKAMVKANYHKDFVVDEDRHWMLHGWKGRIFCALSVWQPN
uniref:Uncharacterized protein n=1 Tax=Opuntia streptacantha TaxID=393608 RepID=A0A7C8ZXJ4_OPUST